MFTTIIITRGMLTGREQEFENHVLEESDFQVFELITPMKPLCRKWSQLSAYHKTAARHSKGIESRKKLCIFS